MKLLCSWRQRQLAIAAARGETLAANPRLRQHVAQCASCRRFWEDCRQLTGELSALEEPLPAGDAFADAIWAQLSTAPSAHRRTPILIPATLAICIALAFLVWNRPYDGKNRMEPSPYEGEGRVGFLPSPPGRGAGGEVRPKDARVATKLIPSKTKSLAWKHRRLKHRRVAVRIYWRPEKRYAHKKRRTTIQEKPKQVAALKRPTPEQWSAWGAYYEAQGDYQRAAAAYGQAYVQRPDAETGLAAGQAAESAGDVTQALTYYTQILNRPTSKKPPEKGTRWWRDEDKSV